MIAYICVMKILNLYAGIGGNRKLWENVEVTAVELNPKIAEIYQDFFPNDKMVVGDAHKYLLQHYHEFDFIWASPPCPTHSRLLLTNEARKYKISNMHYPDMKLYQEILLLKHFGTCPWVIENVVPFYKPLIAPTVELSRHYFWSNFFIHPIKRENKVALMEIKGLTPLFDFDLSKYDIPNKRVILRNLVDPQIGQYILKIARKEGFAIQEGLFNQGEVA